MTRDAIRNLVTERRQTLLQRIAAACSRVGRRPEEVTLIAVTKTVSAEVASLLPEIGHLDLGENRPQELWAKAATLPPSVRWHMIGHLQRNKVERTLPLATMLHAVDSVRLLEEVEKEAERQGRTVPVLIEINASGESSKDGFAPNAVMGLVESIDKLRHVRVEGLMTMAAPEEDPERCRPTFALLRQLRDQLRGQVEPAHSLKELSMGMSNDFEIGIEEGATLVRLGTVLFDGIVAG